MYKSKYFEHDVMRKCPCGCGLDVKERPLIYIDKAREFAGIPFILNSGARCAEYNKKIGGLENSAHIKGLAFDIDFRTEREMLIIIAALSRVGFNRIGLNTKKKFIHADIDEILFSPAYWTY